MTTRHQIQSLGVSSGLAGPGLPAIRFKKIRPDEERYGQYLRALYGKMTSDEVDQRYDALCRKLYSEEDSVDQLPPFSVQ